MAAGPPPLDGQGGWCCARALDVSGRERREEWHPELLRGPGPPADAGLTSSREAVLTSGVAMYVHESGAAGSPAVVFLHGAGASGLMWRDHLARLGDGFHCLAPDLPGFGRSNHLPFVSRAVTADLVADLVVARVPAGHAHLVGLSWGGGVAHTVLDRHPDLVDRVVIDGAGVLASRSGPVVLLGIAVVAPFLHTRPVTVLFAGIIGMD